MMQESLENAVEMSPVKSLMPNLDLGTSFISKISDYEKS